MKTKFRKITLLFTAIIMSASVALVSCDKEKEVTPVQSGQIVGTSNLEEVAEMPSDFVLMELPEDFTSSPEYQGDYESFVETAEIETQTGPVSIQYYIKGDYDGKMVALAFSPESFEKLGISQDYYLTAQGIEDLNTASERGLITCLKGCSSANPKVPGCGTECWKQFAKDLIDAVW